ncbi:mRNA capping enzyme [Acetobacter orientalis]|uniref:mRNA capping enzyme n=1 Tax=Acetobacter orientalis TaxID=146474 RepID=A0A2Z5ZHX2_9PROT|nr:mRNA capping enzyme [Acetobacter orientalis]
MYKNEYYFMLGVIWKELLNSLFLVLFYCGVAAMVKSSQKWYL